MASMSATRSSEITETVSKREDDVSSEGVVTHLLVDVLAV